MCSGCREGCLCSGLAVMLEWGTALTHAPSFSPHVLPPVYPSHTMPPIPSGSVPLLPGRFLCCPVSEPLRTALHAAHPHPCVFLASHPTPPEHGCRPSPLPSLSRVLLCCRPRLGSLISWCRPVRWAWDAALQPLSEASPTSSLSPYPCCEHELEGGLSSCLSFGVERVLAKATGGGGLDPSPWFAGTPTFMPKGYVLLCSWQLFYAGFIGTVCLKSFLFLLLLTLLARVVPISSPSLMITHWLTCLPYIYLPFHILCLAFRCEVTSCLPN